MNVTGPKKAIQLTEDLFISESLVTGWLIIIFLLVVVLILTHNLKKIPTTKRQAVAEFLVNAVHNLVDENLGPGNRIFSPYIAALAAMIWCGALIGTLGFRPMDVDISVTGTWAVMTFVMITYANIKSNKLSGYLKGLATPLPMTPMNILSEIATPVSLALRLFANVAAGMLIFQVLYGGLVSASVALYNAIGINVTTENSYFNILQVGVPALLSFYFDFFAGTIQTFVFISLTMAYISNARGGEE
jgi:F-type H+-transporting ATPase subunit a